MKNEKVIFNILADNKNDKPVLDRLAELNKDNTKFRATLKRKILEEISRLTFPIFHSEREAAINNLSVPESSVEEKSDSILNFEFNLKKETEGLTEISQIEDYCRRNGITFPSQPQIEQIKRIVAGVLRLSDPNFKK
ncbi:MAG: hypothetical protein WAN61_02480 [Minisyncoccia bacterium]